MTSNHPWREPLVCKTADENSLKNYLLHYPHANLEELTDVFDSAPDLIQQRLAYLEQKGHRLRLPKRRAPAVTVGHLSYSPSTRTWYAH